MMYDDSIQDYFNDLCSHHLSLYANQKQVLIIRRKFTKKQFDALKKCLYQKLFISLFSPYILTNLSFDDVLPNNNSKNIYCRLSEEAFKLQLSDKEEDAQKLLNCKDNVKLLANETIDQVLKVLLLLANHTAVKKQPRRLEYETLEDSEIGFQCFQFDSTVFEMENNVNKHFSNLDVDNSSFFENRSLLFENTPGTFCYQNTAPFLQQQSRESSYSKQTQASLFGGLTCSLSTSMDIALNLPKLPNIPRELEYDKANNTVSTDEGFDELSTFTNTSLIHIFDEPHQAVEEKLSLWDEALSIPPLKYTWEKRGSYNERFDNLFLTELGEHAFDCMYSRKLCEIECITGKMVDAQMCSISQIYRDSLNVLVGIQSKTYTFYPMSCSLKPKSNIRCSGYSLESLNGIMTKFAQVGTHYRQLNKFSQHHSDKPLIGVSGGFILKGFIDAMKDILYSYWSAVFIIEDVEGLTLMELWGVFSRFARQLKILADLCLCSEAFKRTTRNAPKPKFPLGANLLSYLYSLCVKNSSTEHYPVLLYLFKSAANPFIRFVTDWIFDGVSNDLYNEFFVLMDQHYLCFRDKHFWVEGFRMKQSKEAIPLFLDHLADDIFACGKAINLLKLTNIQHYLFEKGLTQPTITVTFSSRKLESVENKCQQYLTQVEKAKLKHEQKKALKKLEEEEEWRNKLKDEKQKSYDALQKIEELEREVKKAIQTKKHEEFIELKTQFEQAVEEQRTFRERKLEEDRQWLEVMRKHDEKDDHLKKQARDELVAFYENLSRKAEEREFRANWIISRHELSEKRINFLKTEEDKLLADYELFNQKSTTEPPNIVKTPESFDTVDGNITETSPPHESQLQTIIQDFIKSSTDVGENLSQSVDIVNDLDQAMQSLKSTDIKDTVSSKTSTYHQQFTVHQLEKREVSGHSATEGGTTKTLLYPGDIIQQTNPTVEPCNVDGTETKNLLYPGEQPDTLEHNKTDSNFVEGAETKNLLYPVTSLSTGTVVPVDNNVNIDLNTVEGAETKNLLYPAIKEKQTVSNVDMNTVEGAETKNLLYPINTPEVLPHVVTSDKVEGSETKNLLYPTQTVDADSVRINNDNVEGSETKSLLYPTGVISEQPKHQKSTQIVEGSETKALMYPTTTEPRDNAPTNEPKHVEGSETKALLYSSDAVEERQLSTRGVSSEGSETKNLLYSANTTTQDVVQRDFEKPSEIQNLLYPDGSTIVIQDEQVKRVSRGFEPPTTITRLMYPIEEKKSSTQHEVQKLKPEELWMDSIVEPYQDDFSIMDKPPQPYLFGTGANVLSQHFDMNEPETDADIIKQLPLETIIKRSLTTHIQAQVSLVNKAVIEYFLNDLNIEDHFDAFRKFLLLEDGEFGHSLCSQLFEKISSGMKPQDFCNTIRLNNIIIEALRVSLYASKIKYSSQLTFELKYIPDVFQPSDVGAFDFLELRYRVPWPCNIIVTENSITKYNKVFSFLLKLKKAGWSLQEVWTNLKKAGHDKKAAMSPQLRQLQLYRHEMQHFVNNLERYIVNQIIHVSGREFQQDLLTKENGTSQDVDLKNQVHSLDDLHKCHMNYLNKIIFRSLLSKNAAPVYKLINDIFGMIAKFEARLLTTPWQQDETSGYVTHALFSKLKAVHGAFKQCGEFLFSVISKLVRRGYQDHLDDLLLQVNFNSYYTTALVKK